MLLIVSVIACIMAATNIILRTKLLQLGSQAQITPMARLYLEHPAPAQPGGFLSKEVQITALLPAIATGSILTLLTTKLLFYP